MAFLGGEVYTETVLKRDREVGIEEDVHFEWQAIRQIAKRIQNEETWKLVFKQIEQERS